MIIDLIYKENHYVISKWGKINKITLSHTEMLVLVEHFSNIQLAKKDNLLRNLKLSERLKLIKSLSNSCSTIDLCKANRINRIHF